MFLELTNQQEAYLAWPAHIHATVYNDTIIVLNEREDSFTFFDDDQTRFIRSVWGINIYEIDDVKKAEVTQLVASGLAIFSSNPNEPISNDVKKSTGMVESRWAVMDRGIKLEQIRAGYFLKASIYLRKAQKLSKSRKLSALLSGLRSKTPTSQRTSDAQLLLIALNVNFAMKFMLKNVQCLEFAYAVARIAWESGLLCSFKIGVQIHPFISHAWIEGSNGVVMDRSAIPHELSTLVSIG